MQRGHADPRSPLDGGLATETAHGLAHAAGDRQSGRHGPRVTDRRDPQRPVDGAAADDQRAVPIGEPRRGDDPLVADGDGLGTGVAQLLRADPAARQPDAGQAGALRGLDDYLTAHFARVRANPDADDPFALLAASGELTDRELVTNAALLIGAGFETTVNLIGNGIVALLEHPAQLERLRAEPDLWPNAVEEILRYVRRKLAMSHDYPRESRLFAYEILQGAPHLTEILGGGLREIVDREAAHADPVTREHMRRAFHRACALELAFFAQTTPATSPEGERRAAAQLA